jgi:putative ABC transport system permease protein
MFSSYFSSAIANLLRNKLHAAINLLGLAVGLATAILIGLYVRDELTFEHFLPGWEDLYRIETVDTGQDGKPYTSTGAPHELAAAMLQNFPEIAAITRRAGANHGFRRGDVEATEVPNAVDPDFFRVLGLQMLTGDPATALATPGSIALPRSLAMKYFGTVNCVGQTIEIDRKEILRVSGVFEDVPSNTFLAAYGPRPLISSLVPFSVLAELDRSPPPTGDHFIRDVNIYVRLKPGTNVADLNRRLSAFIAEKYPLDRPELVPRGGFLAPFDAIHLHGREFGDFSSSSDPATVAAIAATGILVLVVAGINFVNLVTARAARRAVEIGVRKAAGATRRQLIAQFMGESIAYALVALILAVALVELVLPRFDLYLDRTIAFPYWRDPVLLAVLSAGAVALGLLAGVYPALVLSRFSPALMLRGPAATPGSTTLRQGLVVLQYAISIALLIATAVIYRQNAFATEDSLRFDKDLIVSVWLTGLPNRPSADHTHTIYDGATIERMRQRFENLPGVRAAADSWVIPDANDHSPALWHLPESQAAPAVMAGQVHQNFGFFEVYGVSPLAGRRFDRDHGEDAAPATPTAEGTAILNEAAVHAFGFASPEAALGHEISRELDATGSALQPRRIVGVVPDFPLSTIRTAIPPTVFEIDPEWSTYISIKLTGDDVPGTLAAIDRIWKEMVPEQPIWRQFIDDRIERLYRDVTRQGQIFAGFALVAVSIACLGIFGLAAFTAERRTKEIGIRKAMGAATADIVRLLIWEFAKPVLLANLVAWPLAYIVMRRWLDGFAYRISLDPLLFVGAGLLTLVVACGVTLFHAIQVARSRPVLALRYE